MKLIFLGAPGSGKGTQAERISKWLNIPTLSTGDMFRAHIRNNTELGQKAKALIDAGKLVPDELVIAMLKDRLAQPDVQDGLILDGFPRTIAQAEALETFLKIDHVILLDVSDETIVQRMQGRRVCPKCGATTHTSWAEYTEDCSKCGTKYIIRDDDKPETVRYRLEIYHEQTAPLVDFYREKGRLAVCADNGAMKPDEITEMIKKALQ